MYKVEYFLQDFHGKVGGVKVKCVDTTGAGDAFVGGLLSSLASNTQLFKVNSSLIAPSDSSFFDNFHS